MTVYACEPSGCRLTHLYLNFSVNRKKIQHSKAAAAKPRRKLSIRRRQKPAQSQVRAAPVARTKVTRSTGPRISHSRDGVTVTHTEYFTVVTAGTAHPGETTEACRVYSFTIQPSDSGIFPWLSQMARSYEFYKFRDITFEYVPRCATSVPGSIIMAIDQDPLDPAPQPDDTGRSEMMNHSHAVSGSAWTGLVLRYPGSLIKKPEMYVQLDSDPGVNKDARLIDVGVFHIGLFGVPLLTTLGDVKVSYTVQFRMPQIHLAQTSAPTTFGVAATDVTNGGVCDAQFPLTVKSSGAAYANVTLNAVGDLAHEFVLGVARPLAAYGKQRLLDYVGSSGKALTTEVRAGFAISPTDPTTNQQEIIDWLTPDTGRQVPTMQLVQVYGDARNADPDVPILQGKNWEAHKCIPTVVSRSTVAGSTASWLIDGQFPPITLHPGDGFYLQLPDIPAILQSKLGRDILTALSVALFNSITSRVLSRQLRPPTMPTTRPRQVCASRAPEVDDESDEEPAKFPAPAAPAAAAAPMRHR